MKEATSGDRESSVPKVPVVHPSALVAEGAIVRGDVFLDADSSVWYNAVVRGDVAPVRVGARSNVQDCCVLHVSEGAPLTIGEGVTIGHGAVVHSCTVGDNTLVGMGATVLDGAVIGRDCIVGAGALVPRGMRVPDGSVAFGNPAKVVRPMRPEDVEANRRNAQAYVDQAARLRESGEC